MCSSDFAGGMGLEFFSLEKRKPENKQKKIGFISFLNIIFL